MPESFSATFTIEHSENPEPYFAEDGLVMATAKLRKRFTGEVAGHSEVEMMSTRSEDGGAGYVAMERLQVDVDGRRGSFVLLHMGTMSGSASSGTWPIVPGSGRGQLAGIQGSAELERPADGSHRFILSCSFGS